MLTVLVTAAVSVPLKITAADTKPVQAYLVPIAERQLEVVHAGAAEHSGRLISG